MENFGILAVLSVRIEERVQTKLTRLVKRLDQNVTNPEADLTSRVISRIEQFGHDYQPWL